MASYLSSSSSPNSDPISLLQNCTNPKHLTQIHAKLIKSTNISYTQNHIIGTKLLRLYSSYGNLNYATSVFNLMNSPPTFTWNLIIRAHTINGFSRKSVVLFNLMICDGVSPDKFTFPFVLKACAGIRSVEKGKEVHGFAIKTGYYSRDLFVKNTLLDMYLKCGELGYARKVFDEMSVRNVVSWTTMVSGLVAVGEVDSARGLFDQMHERNVVSWSAMINGYVASGRPQEAFELFAEMQEEGVIPNEFTLVMLLRACTELGSLRLGTWVHEYALKNGFKLGAYLGTALVDMYSKCGSLDEARKVFNTMEERSLATWNSMISSLGVHGCGEEALSLFEQMIQQHVMPDAITFAGVLSACVQTNQVNEGLRYFSYMIGKCGIVPVLEHYVYMFELWRRANEMVEIRYLKGDWTWDKTKVVMESLGTDVMDEATHQRAN
ncbi:hypothetical protein RND81_02G166100 [Saponaria officinalis]|uniref:Pentatricopeptide repeat-containing protein n=1 Tax=Saponaria officinalis TaxID=3572 RepID=A0AAW1MQS0_SAPOF